MISLADKPGTAILGLVDNISWMFYTQQRYNTARPTHQFSPLGHRMASGMGTGLVAH